MQKNSLLENLESQQLVLNIWIEAAKNGGISKRRHQLQGSRAHPVNSFSQHYTA
jgi:hypothetical protein